MITPQNEVVNVRKYGFLHAREDLFLYISRRVAHTMLEKAPLIPFLSRSSIIDSMYATVNRQGKLLR